MSDQAIEGQGEPLQIGVRAGEDDEVFRTFRKIVSEQLDVAEEMIKPEARIVDDLGADSLQVIELALMLEEKFSIELPDRELEHFRTVGSAMNRLLELLAAKGTPVA